MEKSESTRPLKASDITSKYDGPRIFKPIKKDRIMLSGDGVFGPTVQGEGVSIGKPVVFARLHHCNLKCSWCDAFYSWDKDSEEFWTEGEYVTFNECADLLVEHWGSISRQPTVVWSGGEPLMQRNQIDEVMSLLWKDLHKPLWKMEIETNGTVMPTSKQLRYAQFNCSPKVPSSGNSMKTALKPKVLEAINAANSCFKFVCSSENDLAEVEELYLPYISREKVYIMPEGVIEEEISKHARLIVNATIQYGFNMTPRLQAIAFDGAKRGV